MKRNTLLFTGILGISMAFAACSDTGTFDRRGTDSNRGRYVIAATGEDADYLLQAEDLTSGSITALGNGIESSGNRNWVFHRDAAYSFLYSKGDPGKATSYVLNSEGQLQRHSELDLTISVTTRGFYKDDIVLINSTRSLTDTRGTFYFVDAVKHSRSEAVSIDTKELATLGGADGKMAYFTDVAQVDDKIYLAYKPINGTGSGNANTMKVEIYGKVFLAVFNYNETTNTLTYERSITDEGRTSFVAGASSSQAETGVVQADNGHVYVFSSATTDPSGETDYPSAVLRIKKGATEFDKDYFFNIEALSGNHHLYRVWYLGESVFALQMYTVPDVAAASEATAYKFAIADVEAKTFRWVTGTPDASTVTAVSKPFVSKDDQTIAFAITTQADYPHIYTIDAKTASATKGLEIIAEGVSGIGMLHY